MPRLRVMPRKSTRPRPPLIGSTDRLYETKPEQYFDLADFFKEFRRAWLLARRHGVSDLDAIHRMVHVMPAHWQGWASTSALDYIDFTKEPEEAGDFLGFHATVRAQNRNHQGPSPGDYPPIQHFHPFIRQLFAEHRVRRDNPPPQPAIIVPHLDVPAPRFDEPMIIDRNPAVAVAVEPVDSPQLVDLDVQQEPDDYYTHPELDLLFAEMFVTEGIPFPDPELEIPVIDADLYEQPFAIASPAPLIDLAEPVSPQNDSITPVSEIIPGAYPVHAVSRDSLPPIAPESSLISTNYPSPLLEVHLIHEPPPPDDEGTSSS